MIDSWKYEVLTDRTVTPRFERPFSVLHETKNNDNGEWPKAFIAFTSIFSEIRIFTRA